MERYSLTDNREGILRWISPCDVSLNSMHMPNYFFFVNDDFDCAKFLSVMHSIYSCFYDKFDGGEEVYEGLVKCGDELLANEALKPFVLELVKERGDYISSDRECAAFAATFNIYAAV